MRIAFFSPLPPAKSGIADYSSALLHSLKSYAEVDAFEKRPPGFNPSRYDICLYQIGNNAYHSDVYELALEVPGIVVVHEANLHHLMAERTIRRGDWDAYLREVEHDGGPEALEYAVRYVRTLERGPDYLGVPMLRRLLERSRAAIVHSDYVGDALKAAGYEGPTMRIWHGAWNLEPERLPARERLGVDELAPLIGVFGFMKPYKRIAESLRAFQRIVRLEPRAKLILAGEQHPELPLGSMIRALGLESSVRTTGYLAEDEMNSLIGACDIVLNLRYPTVGESSGTLLRALSMGAAVIVSDVGSFSEYPDDVVLKVPVDETEEQVLFEYLNLLVSRPHLAREMGARAREWVRRECSWDVVAQQYVQACRMIAEGLHIPPPPPPVPGAVESQVETAARIEFAKLGTPRPTSEAFTEEILSWTAPDAREYAESHITRLERTLQITPVGGADCRILEMGAYLQITPALKTRLGYGEVRGCYYGTGGSERKQVQSSSGDHFECPVDLFNAEKDAFPYADGYFATVLCCELIEHLFEDPMHMMSEINRVLRMGGHLVLTTPNIASLRALSGLLQGFQPGLFPSYIRPRANGEVDARHNREYTPREVSQLLVNSGFEVALLETGPFLDKPAADLGWVSHLLERYILPQDLRGDGIYAVGRKTGGVRERYPEWLYS